ncbi:MAG: hypothetical protein ACW979_14725 [Candidatus Thorarchaeota archaeon]|jgi:hypothetical protein
MSDDEKLTLNEFHKKVAIKTNGGVWSVLDKESPTEDDLDNALEMAHTSLYHWRQIGKPINIARGEYMISRVLSGMGKGEAALYHAECTLKLTEDADEKADFDMGFAYEVLAKAYATKGDKTNCKKYKDMAQKVIDTLGDEDKKISQGELDKIKC